MIRFVVLDHSTGSSVQVCMDVPVLKQPEKISTVNCLPASDKKCIKNNICKENQPLAKEHSNIFLNNQIKYRCT